MMDQLNDTQPPQAEKLPVLEPDPATERMRILLARMPRLHEPGILHLWTLAQHEVWVDMHGREMRLDEMDQPYLINVVLMLRSNCDRLHRRMVEPADPFAYDRAAAREWIDSQPLVQEMVGRIGHDPDPSERTEYPRPQHA